MFHAAENRPNEAIDALVAMRDLTAENLHWRCYAIHEAVRVLVHVGEIDVARSLIPSQVQPITRTELARRTALALLDEADQSFESAAAQYRELSQAWGTFGHVLEVALADLGQARCSTRLGFAVEAERPATRSEQVLRDLGVHS